MVPKEQFYKLFDALHHQKPNQNLPKESNRKLAKFSEISKHISLNYFYETVAGFETSERLERFFYSIKIGDKFLAKVQNVFKHSAEVVLLWSSKNDIKDLKIKAHLRLSNKMNQHHQSSINDDQWMNIDVSDLILVEVIQLDRKNHKIELIRCKNIDDHNNDFEDIDDIDEDSLKTGKYCTIQPEKTSFHDYMMDHNDLRNPSLIKFYPFTSLINANHIINCLEHRNKISSIVENESNKTIKNPQAPVNEIFEDKSTSDNIRKSTFSDTEKLSSLKKFKTKSNEDDQTDSSESNSSSRNRDHSKRKHSKHRSKHKTSHQKHRKKSSSKKRKSKSKHHHHHQNRRSSSSSSSSSSPSSDDDHRHSKRSKKKKKHRHRYQQSNNNNNNKINDKILKLLKYA